MNQFWNKCVTRQIVEQVKSFEYFQDTLCVFVLFHLTEFKMFLIHFTCAWLKYKDVHRFISKRQYVHQQIFI